MSYIRCLSNPEGLYIWAQSDGRTCITHNVRAPLSSVEKPKGLVNIIVPTTAFDRACILWDEGNEPASCRGVRVEEVHVLTKTGKPVPENFFDFGIGSGKLAARMKKNPVELLIKLSYKKEFVFMWRVTWEYIVRHAVLQAEWKREDQDKHRRARARKKGRRS